MFTLFSGGKNGKLKAKDILIWYVLTEDINLIIVWWHRSNEYMGRNSQKQPYKGVLINRWKFHYMTSMSLNLGETYSMVETQKANYSWWIKYPTKNKNNQYFKLIKYLNILFPKLREIIWSNLIIAYAIKFWCRRKVMYVWSPSGEISSQMIATIESRYQRWRIRAIRVGRGK